MQLITTMKKIDYSPLKIKWTTINVQDELSTKKTSNHTHWLAKCQTEFFCVPVERSRHQAHSIPLQPFSNHQPIAWTLTVVSSLWNSLLFSAFLLCSLGPPICGPPAIEDSFTCVRILIWLFAFQSNAMKSWSGTLRLKDFWVAAVCFFKWETIFYVSRTLKASVCTFPRAINSPPPRRNSNLQPGRDT